MVLFNMASLTSLSRGFKADSVFSAVSLLLSLMVNKGNDSW